MSYRRLVFRCGVVLLAVLTVCLGLLAADFYVHHKFDAYGGLNRWGYRGPVIGRKQAGEQRIVVIGESTAFGYGVRWQEAFPAVLETLLRRQSAPPVSVVNLAYNNEGAYSYRVTLREYAYLAPDVVLFYSGYNNLWDRNFQVARHESLVFRLTGYYPLLPVVMREKAMVIRSGGRLEDAYWGRPTVFRPPLAARVVAGGLETAGFVGDTLAAQLGKLSGRPSDVHETVSDCGAWPSYCSEMSAAISVAFQHAKRVVMISQPTLASEHLAQQTLLVAHLRRQFHDDSRLSYVNLAATVSLSDRRLSYDGMHLTAEGNRRIAAALAPYVRAMIEAGPAAK